MVILVKSTPRIPPTHKVEMRIKGREREHYGIGTNFTEAVANLISHLSEFKFEWVDEFPGGEKNNF